MKKLFYLSLFLILIPSQIIKAQSPYFRVNISAQENNSTYPVFYNYEFKLFLPENWSTEGSISEPETSLLDLTNLSSEFYSNLRTLILQSESDKFFIYGNQLMPYEGIGNITITRTRNKESDTMRLVFFISRKAFITFLNLKDIEFIPGLYDITNSLDYIYESDSKLLISLISNYKWTEVFESNLWIE